MAHVIFYEKPGCGGNRRQKALLTAAGHSIEARDLLGWPWTAQTLLEFLAPLPVATWFNRAAPAIKTGRVVPESLDADSAIALLLAEPLLIRRPLMQVDDARRVGFDVDQVDAWIGLGDTERHGSLEGCAAAQGESCAGHDHDQDHHAGHCGCGGHHHAGHDTEKPAKNLAMPLYDYTCRDCGATAEMLVRVGSTNTPRCPHCGSEALDRHIGKPTPPGRSKAIIASARRQAAREGHFSNYSAAERAKLPRG